MKILKISFKNINSLRGEHKVDFMIEPLSNAGIFAITGPTGSGKTTLLDVISLALYNNIPRMDVSRISKAMIGSTGSVMTRNTTEAYASVEYECSDGIFISKWEISKAKTGNLRDYHMEIADEIGLVLDVKKSEVPAKNEKLIGLSYDQFVRSMVLAQGEFSKFLKSKKADRGALLEKITGTEIYRQLGIMAFDKFRKHGQLLDNMKIQKETLSKDLLSNEDQANIKRKLKEINEEIKLNQEKKESLTSAINLKKSIVAMEDQIAKSLKSEHFATKELESFNNDNEVKLRTHESLLPIEEDLRSYKQLTEEYTELIAKLKVLKIQLEEAENNKKIAYNEIAIFTNSDPENDDLVILIDEFETKVTRLNDQLKDAKIIYDNNKQFAHNIGHDVGIDIPDIIDENVISDFENLCDSYKNKTSILSNELSEEELGNPNFHLDLIAKQKQLAGEWRIHDETLKRNKVAVLECENNISKLGDAILEYGKNIEKQEYKVKVANLEFEQLQKDDQIRRLQAKYEEDRKELEEGNPCPLCGSSEHPFVSHYEALDDNLDFKIEEKKREAKEAETHLTELRQDFKNKGQQVSLAKQQLIVDQSNVDRIAKQISIIKQTLPESIVIKDAKEVFILLTKREDTIKEWINIKKVYEKLVDLIPYLKVIQKSWLQSINLKSEIAKLYKGHDIRSDVRKLKETYQHFVRQKEMSMDHISDNKKNTDQLQSKINETFNKLKLLINRKGFSSPEEALTKLLSGQVYAELMRKQNNLNQKVSEEIKARKIHENNLIELKRQDKKESLAELLVLEDNLKMQLVEQQNIRDDLFASNSKQEGLVSSLIELDRVLSEENKKNEKWVLLKEYIGDASGNKFANFAQQLTLQHLVSLANKRLKNLTRRYLLDIPNEDIEGDNLVIVDDDMGGMRRSVKTLSGGESFLVSLSLALGLSDLASKNVDINSLFIDEGFGTLDPETLDLVMDTLENIHADSNKTIGIISHVEAIKERVATQIEVIPNGQGYSKLRVNIF